MAFIQLTKNNIKVGAVLRRHGSYKQAVVTHIDSTFFKIKWNQVTPGYSVTWAFDSIHDMSWDIDEDSPYLTYLTINALKGFDISKRIEHPCQVCSRMNDEGITICWSCGNQP